MTTLSEAAAKAGMSTERYLLELNSRHDELNSRVRKFESGADRDTDEGKLDFEACLSPAVLEAFADYMRSKSVRNDGTRRPGDNWQRGMPKDSYMKSMWRHFHDVWMLHRGYDFYPDGEERPDILECLMALLFNVQGMAYEVIKEEREVNTNVSRW